MRRRSGKHEEHENHERWLISYADFITLMFAFFVVMYASSQADRNRARELSEAVERALSEGRVTARIEELLHIKPKPAAARLHEKTAELKSPLEELKHALREDIAKGHISVTMEARGLVISLKQAAFFPTGDTTVAHSGYTAIGKVAETLRRIANPIRLEGHTDSIPIRNERFGSNWHLSAERSIAMLELLTNSFGLPPDRLAVVGYAETVPIDTNSTEEGRARNRRVDITVLNDSSVGKEPQAGSDRRGEHLE